MATKEIQLLEQQIQKLDAKDFELEAWKKYTIVMLGRIFGDKSEKINLIDKLEYEFSSWSLRDASGNESYEEGTKKLAREILQASIDEMIAFGIPQQLNEVDRSQQSIKELLNLLLYELKGSQVKQLRSILTSQDNLDEKKRKIKEILEVIGEYDSYSILTSMLLHPDSINYIK